MKTYEEYIQMAIDKKACSEGIEYAKRFDNLKDFLNSDDMIENIKWFFRFINDEPENLLLVENKQNAFDFACDFAYGCSYIEVLKLLLQDSRVDPSAENNYAIIRASYHGYTEVVKLLLQDSKVDPSADNNYAFRVASYYSFIDIVKLLLQDSRVDPSAKDNYAFRVASHSGNSQLVKLLLKDPRVKNTLTEEEIEKYENRKI